MLYRRFIFVLLLLVACGVRVSGAPAAAAVVVAAKGVNDLSRYEGRMVASVEVVYEGAARNATGEGELRRLLTVAPNAPFAALRVRESLQALFDSGRVENARVEATEARAAVGLGGEAVPIALRFFVRPQVRVTDVRLDLVGTAAATTPTGGAPVTADDLRARLNLLDPGARVSDQSLRAGADAIQIYLRDRGYFRADVTYTRTLDAAGTGAIVAYTVNPGEQARVEAFNIQITGFDVATVRPDLRLAAGVPFTRTALGEDVGRIRRAIMAQGFLAPQLGEAQTVIDSARNTITVNLTGGIGPRVNVEVTGFEVSDKKREQLLPVQREGSIDQAAITEGARRLKNHLQEQGYFFADVISTCAVDRPAPPASTVAVAAAAGNANTSATPPANTDPNAPATPATTANANVVTPNANPSNPPPAATMTNAATPTSPANPNVVVSDPLAQPIIGLPVAAGACDNLNPRELSGRTVNINYTVEQGRRFKLSEIRIEGTEKLTYDDLADELRSEPASGLLGIIPFLGSRRGYTSRELLVRDRRTVEARMRDLGYRKATVEVRQGVALDSEDLIITFAVTEGPLTRVAGVDFRGNQLYTTERLREEPCRAANFRSEPCTIVAGPFARTLARADAERIRSLYTRNGYIDAEVRVDVVELPKKGDDEQVRLVYNVTEGGKVFINRIIINGNEGTTPDARMRTKREAILEAIPLKEGEVLRSDRLAEAERVLYETNAFRQVIIRTEAAGETAAGFRRRDVIIDLEELKPRRLDYGGGYSTDSGPLGLFELRNNNLFGQLRQGALRTRASRRQQLFRLEYFDPRFRTYGRQRFSPLTVSAQYQRDINVTRFFRSTIDRGNFGIVQRLDEEGRPIDEFGMRTGEPTINRFTFNIETQRVIQPRSRTILFLRYNYEDVRLFNIQSLLVAPILRPDKAVRLSRFGATLARDTRDRQFDPSRGEFLTVDYAVAIKQLGGNLSFTKLLATYRRYFRFGGPPDPLLLASERGGLLGGLQSRVRGTVFAVNLNLGVASLFNPTDRNGDGTIDDVDQTLPISERFFTGGSTTLRGFAFEEAGPRLAVCPTGSDAGSQINVPFCTGGVFRNTNGDPVTLNPFTVPVGGNAMAVVNLEARVPLTKTFQIVPFYDGGNVFRRIGDIFGRNDRRPGDTINMRNLRVQWAHTVGLGLRFRTPIGALGIDYGFLVNPPEFELPQAFPSPPATVRLRRAQLHFRFGQAF
ncbi:MAG: outer membrane protein insertion porin family [Pyrinomonadaceae bacterium]|nr:outer membrane protein insertion porin family [Pyrinomonadaceae bacterium]